MATVDTVERRELRLEPIFYFLVAFAGTAFVFWAACRFFPVHVFDWGIRGYDAMGKYSDVPWDSMETASRIRFFGVPYVVVGSRNPAVQMWLPLYFSDQK